MNASTLPARSWRFQIAALFTYLCLATISAPAAQPPAQLDDFGIPIDIQAPPYDDGHRTPIDLLEPWPGWRAAPDLGGVLPQGCEIILIDPNDVPWSFYIDIRVARDTVYEISDVYGFAMAPPVNDIQPYQPCVDFFASFEEPSRRLSVSFARSGVYVLCTNDFNGDPTFYTVAVGAPRGGSGRVAMRDGVPKLLQAAHLPRELQTFDLVLVENPVGGDNGFDAAAFTNLKQIRAPVQKIKSVQEGIDAIVARSNRLGRPINVLIAGHGAGGTVGMGSGQGNGDDEQDKQFIGIDSEKNRDFIRGVKGKVKGVYMFGCNVATGQGKRVMKQMAQRLSDDNINCVVAGHNRLVVAWTQQGNRPGGLYVYGDRRNRCDITANVQRGR